MTITVADAIKDPKKLVLLKAFVKKEFSTENLDFILDKGSNEAVYKKWISKQKGSPVINLPGNIADPLHAMALAKNWKDMTPGLNAGRTNVTKLMQADTMRRFEAELIAAAAPSAAARAAATKIEADITTGAAFFTTAIATVKAKGKPADRIEVNRMFESGRLRHDKVHEAFTELLQKDKTITRANAADFFNKERCLFQAVGGVSQAAWPLG